MLLTLESTHLNDHIAVGVGGTGNQLPALAREFVGSLFVALVLEFIFPLHRRGCASKSYSTNDTESEN